VTEATAAAAAAAEAGQPSAVRLNKLSFQCPCTSRTRGGPHRVMRPPSFLRDANNNESAANGRRVILALSVMLRRRTVVRHRDCRRSRAATSERVSY